MKAPPTDPDKQVPFVRCPIEGLERIERELELGNAASAKLVYLALHRIAFKERTWTFAKPVNYIANLSSVGPRTVIRRLPDLERLGLVAVTRNKIEGTQANDLSTYTLPTLSQKVVTLSQKVVTVTKPHAVRVIEKEDKTSSLSEDQAMILEAIR